MVDPHTARELHAPFPLSKQASQASQFFPRARSGRAAAFRERGLGERSLDASGGRSVARGTPQRAPDPALEGAARRLRREGVLPPDRRQRGERRPVAGLPRRALVLQRDCGERYFGGVRVIDLCGP